MLVAALLGRRRVIDSAGVIANAGAMDTVRLCALTRPRRDVTGRHATRRLHVAASGFRLAGVWRGGDVPWGAPGP